MKSPGETKGKQVAQAFAKLTPWHVIGILTLLVAIFFRDILLQKSFFWEDFIYQYYAFRDFAAVSLSSGTLPLWNPYTFSGMPFQADIQTAVFYVPNLILTLFVSGGKLYFLWVEVLIILHFVLAGAGMYLFMRELGLERMYALFSGIAFTFSGFMIMQVIHQTFVCQVAWLPLILLCLRRTVLRKSPFWMIVTGLLLGHAILAGSPQFSVYILLLLLGYFLFESIPVLRSSRPLVSIALLALGGGVIVIALGLTSLQLLPTMEIAKLSQRAEITFAKSSEGSLHFQQLVTLIAPKYFGASGAQGSNFWLGQNYWEYWETCIYLGIIPLIAAAAGLFVIKRQRNVAFFFGVLIFGYLYSLGDDFFFHSFFFHFIPGFDKFRVPARMSVLFLFGATVLGGYGLKFIVEAANADPKRLRKFLLGAAASGVLIWVAGQAGLFQPSRDIRMYEQVHPIVADNTLLGMIMMLIACGIFFAYLRKTISLSTLLVLLILLHFIDMNIFGFEQNNGQTNPDTYYSRGADLVNMMKEEGKTEYFRINTRLGGAMLLDRNQGMVDRIFTLEGYTPLALQRNYPVGPSSYDVLNAKYRIRIDTASQTMGIQQAANYTPRAFLVTNIKVFSREADERSYMESGMFKPLQEVLLEEDPHFATDTADTATAGQVNITSYDLNRITMDLSARKRAILVVSEIYYPGWEIFVDGKEQPIYRADWCLRATPVTVGDHHVELLFRPESFYTGAAISAATVLFSIVGMVVLSRRSRKTRLQPTAS